MCVGRERNWITLTRVPTDWGGVKIRTFKDFKVIINDFLMTLDTLQYQNSRCIPEIA